VTTDHLVPRTQAAKVLRAKPILLCMGLFSRFCVRAYGVPPKSTRTGSGPRTSKFEIYVVSGIVVLGFRD
jgi:hypothetical protein